MQINQIKKDALAHYDIMLIWLWYIYNLFGNVDIGDFKKFYNINMYGDISETPYMTYCSYCTAFYHKNHGCKICPLNYYIENYHCCNNLWQKMVCSTNIFDLIINMQNVKQYISDHG